LAVCHNHSGIIQVFLHFTFIYSNFIVKSTTSRASDTVFLPLFLRQTFLVCIEAYTSRDTELRVTTPQPCFVSELCEGTSVTRPVIRFIGDTVVLQCRTNGSAWMSWSHGLAGSIASTSRGVSSEYPRLSLNESTEGQFDLLINLTQREDAGLYRCSVFDPIVKAELILLGE